MQPYQYNGYPTTDPRYSTAQGMYGQYNTNPYTAYNNTNPYSYMPSYQQTYQTMPPYYSLPQYQTPISNPNGEQPLSTYVIQPLRLLL